MRHTSLLHRTALATILISAAVASSAPALAPASDATAATAPVPPNPSATLDAKLIPLRLGQRTTLSFAFQISAGTALPPALVAVQLSYPANLGIGLSGLGLATCSEATLQTLGSGSCPANSTMGYGEASAEITLGPNLVGETAPLTILRAPEREGHLALLFYATGTSPLDAHVVFPGTLLAAPPPFGGLVSIGVPLIPSVPGAPNVALVRLRATLGPDGVTYFERVAHQTLAYRPRGILLPDTCPRGGFPFAAELSFANGDSAHAQTTVPCPRKRRSR